MLKWLVDFFHFVSLLVSTVVGVVVIALLVNANEGIPSLHISLRLYALFMAKYWQVSFRNDLGPRCRPSSYCVRSFAIRLNLFSCFWCLMSITCSRYFCHRRYRRTVLVRRTKNTNEKKKKWKNSQWKGKKEGKKNRKYVLTEWNYGFNCWQRPEFQASLRTSR